MKSDNIFVLFLTGVGAWDSIVNMRCKPYQKMQVCALTLGQKTVKALAFFRNRQPQNSVDLNCQKTYQNAGYGCEKRRKSNPIQTFFDVKFRRQYVSAIDIT